MVVAAGACLVDVVGVEVEFFGGLVGLFGGEPAGDGDECVGSALGVPAESFAVSAVGGGHGCSGVSLVTAAGLWLGWGCN